MMNRRYYRIGILMCLVGLILAGCASRKPLHKKLETRVITVGVISAHESESAGGPLDGKWQNMASGTVSGALQNPGMVENVLSSTEGAAESAGFVSSDTYELKLVNRDKLREIMEEKKKQHSTGAFKKARKRMEKIYGLDLIITVRLRDVSRSTSEYETESYITSGTSHCREVKIHSIMNIEAIMVSDGEVVQTGEYEGTSVREQCDSDDPPPLDAFNLSKMKLESLERAAFSFGSDFRSIL